MKDYNSQEATLPDILALGLMGSVVSREQLLSPQAPPRGELCRSLWKPLAGAGLPCELSGGRGGGGCCSRRRRRRLSH